MKGEQGIEYSEADGNLLHPFKNWRMWNIKFKKSVRYCQSKNDTGSS